jgi:hypothetical protein
MHLVGYLYEDSRLLIGLSIDRHVGFKLSAGRLKLTQTKCPPAYEMRQSCYLLD